MYTSSISAGTAQAVNAYTTSASTAKAAETQEEETSKQTSDTPKTADQDTYTPSEKKDSGSYQMDVETVKQMKAEFEEQKLRFLETVKKVLGNQISYGQGAWKDISPEDQAAAKEAISEDGYWGVKQTSERIVAFGKALVGGDPSRAEEMRDAFIKGYEAAEKAWGGALPEISKQTYDAVMKLFDEWVGKKDDAGELESAAGAESEEPE